MKEHVTQADVCLTLSHSFWTTMQLYGTKKYD